MRVLALIIAVGAAAPAWAQAEPESRSCSWCISAELGIAMGAALTGAGVALGVSYATNTAWENAALLLPLGVAVGLLIAWIPIAKLVVRSDERPLWLGAALGAIAAVVLGPLVFAICIGYRIASTDTTTSGYVALGGLTALALSPALVMAGVEIQRGIRLSFAPVPLPGGGAVVLRGEL